MAGVMLVIEGEGNTSDAAEAVVPPGVVTLIEPNDPCPTTAVIEVLEFTVKEAAGSPPIERVEVPVK